jgi:hypothetical protein
MTLDPVALWVARGVVSLLFAAAAAHKWRDVAHFSAAVEAYQVVPPIWTVPVGAGLIAAETGVAVALWVPPVAPIAALAAAALLSLYAAVIAVNLVRGRRALDCGCAGPARRQPISWALVARNLVLAGVALAGALPGGLRAVSWIDQLTIAGGVSALALLYAAVDGLLANAPASAALRERYASDTAGEVAVDG